MNPLAMLFTMVTVFALCNVIYACWRLYRARRGTKATSLICRHCGRHGVFHGRIGSECPGLPTRFEEM